MVGQCAASATAHRAMAQIINNNSTVLGASLIGQGGNNWDMPLNVRYTGALVTGDVLTFRYRGQKDIRLRQFVVDIKQLN